MDKNEKQQIDPSLSRLMRLFKIMWKHLKDLGVKNPDPQKIMDCMEAMYNTLMEEIEEQSKPLPIDLQTTNTRSENYSCPCSNTNYISA